MDRNRIAKENQYFLKDLETMNREELRKLQFEKTKETLERAYNKSEFYRELFDKAKVKPEDFKKLELAPDGVSFILANNKEEAWDLFRAGFDDPDSEIGIDIDWVLDLEGYKGEVFYAHNDSFKNIITNGYAQVRGYSELKPMNGIESIFDKAQKKT